MRLARLGMCVGLMGCVTFGTAGCIPAAMLDLLNAGMKIMNEQISTLTPQEIKTLNEVAIGIINEQTGQNLPPLTDEQADAISAFFVANELNTFADFEQLADQAEADPSQIEGLAELAAAFDNIDADDPDPDELEDLFESIFTGGQGFTGFDD